MNKTTDDILKEEIDAIKADIIKVYESSGRKVSGNFTEGLEVVYEPNKATLKGFVYLAGRGRTKNKGKAGEPTVLERIKVWIVQKGIVAKALAESKAKTEKAKKNLINGLAYVITRKIHEKGTNRKEWLKIYEQVITPERINEIIEKVSELNVNNLINEISVEIQILEKNV